MSASRGELFTLRLSADELAEWRDEAARDGLSVSAWLRRSARDSIDLASAARRADQEAARRAEHLLSLPPTTVREVLSRSVPPEQWPGSDERGRS